MTMTATEINTTTSACCPSCGSSLPALSVSDPHAALLQAQRQIEDLEAQVRLLSQKATAAVDRWADYEDELARLRATNDKKSCPNTSTTTTVAINNTIQPPTPAASIPATSPRSSFFPARISQLLSPRKSTSNLTVSRAGMSSPHLPAPASPTPSTDDLMEALSREQTLRLSAESKLNETSREVEELSVSLFEQANEMVANERRARAKLEERVGILEKRDEEKRNRLSILEGAMGRIERVRGLLGDDL